MSPQNMESERTGESASRERNDYRINSSLHRDAFNASPDGLLFLKTVRDDRRQIIDFEVQDVNRAGAGILALNSDDIIGNRITEILQINKIPELMATYARVVRDGISVEMKFPDARGHEVLPARWLSHCVTQLGDGLLITIRNATKPSTNNSQPHVQEGLPSDGLAFGLAGSWEYRIESDEYWWSDEAYRVFGVTPESFQPTFERWLEMVHPEDRVHIEKSIKSAIHKGEPFDHALRVLGSAGVEKEIRCRGHVVHNSEGHAILLLGTLIDPTMQPRRDPATPPIHELLQQVVTNAPVILWALDADGIVILAEGKALFRQGLRPSEILGRSIFDIYKDHSDFLANLRRALAGESLVVINETHGVIYERWIEPVRDDNGRVIGVSGISVDITERVQAEEEREAKIAQLRDSERQYRDLIDGSIQGMVIIGADFSIKLTNPAAEQILDLYSGQELDDASSLEACFAKQSAGRIRASIADRIARGDAPTHGNTTLEFANGRTIYVEYVARVVEWHGESSVQYTLIDVTERHKAKSELYASKNLLRSILDNVPYAITVKDADGRIIMANQEVKNFYGVDGEELFGLRTVEIPGARVDEHERLLWLDRHVMETRQPAEIPEIEMTRHDGVSMWRRIQNVPLMDESAQLKGLLGIAEDITERKRIEDYKQEQRSLLQSIIDALPARINVVDEQGVQIFINKAEADLVGLQPDIADAQADGLPDDNEAASQATESEIQSVIKNGQVFDYERQRKQADGRDLFEHIMRVPILGANGDISGALNLAIDITEQKNVEMQLRHAQKMETVGELAGGIAHDFNNLLQIIGGYTEAAIQYENLDPDQISDLRFVREATERASALTRQLLIFSRKQVLQVQQIDINVHIDNLMKMLGRLIGENIELKVESLADPAYVNADPGQLDQLLVNLCVNARDAMPNGGRLLIETATVDFDQALCRQHRWAMPGLYVQLTVSDTGIGIPDDIREKIFVPFFTTKEPGHGTGLGLSIVYGIVQQHEGLIRVYSEPDTGTAFKIYLPVCAMEDASAQETSHDVVKGGDETILIAEDEEQVLALLKMLLESQGYRVLTAINGQEAIEQYTVHEKRIDLILLDVIMPIAGGVEVVSYIRRINSKARIILSTGYTARFVDADYVQRHNLVVIEKPYSPYVLFRTVREILDT